MLTLFRASNVDLDVVESNGSECFELSDPTGSRENTTHSQIVETEAWNCLLFDDRLHDDQAPNTSDSDYSSFQDCISEIDENNMVALFLDDNNSFN